MIKLTAQALSRVKHLLSQQAPGSFLRIGAHMGGCSGMTYDVKFDQKTNEGDTVGFVEGVQVVCDPKSFAYLKGMQIDFSPALVNGGFKFSNPNATGSCGCGTSFSVKTTKPEDKKSCSDEVHH